MSRIIQPTIINIIYEHVLVETNSVMKISVEKTFHFIKFERIQWSQSWSSQVGVAGEMLIFLNLDDGMDEEVHKQ